MPLSALSAASWTRGDRVVDTSLPAHRVLGEQRGVRAALEVTWTPGSATEHRVVCP